MTVVRYAPQSPCSVALNANATHRCSNSKKKEIHLQKARSNRSTYSAILPLLSTIVFLTFRAHERIIPSSRRAGRVEGRLVGQGFDRTHHPIPVFSFFFLLSHFLPTEIYEQLDNLSIRYGCRDYWDNLVFVFLFLSLSLIKLLETRIEKILNCKNVLSFSGTYLIEITL